MLRKIAKTTDNIILLREKLSTRIQSKASIIRTGRRTAELGTKNEKKKVDLEIVRNLYEELEVEAVY